MSDWSCPDSVRTLGPVKTSRIEVRITDEERDLDAAAAAAVGETLSECFRPAARARAELVLAENQRLSLDSVEAARFLAALDEVNEDTVARLRRLADRAGEPAAG